LLPLYMNTQADLKDVAELSTGWTWFLETFVMLFCGMAPDFQGSSDGSKTSNPVIKSYK
jgi:hypothetical protein